MGMAVQPKPLRCLYYPYSRTISATTLKKAILLFDEIVFLDSQPWFIRRELMHDIRKRGSTAGEDEYKYLKEEGIVSIESPEDVIKEYDIFLTTNVLSDIKDKDFCELGVKHDITVWDVLAERIPPSFMSAFYAGAGAFSEAISLQALIKAEGSIEKLDERFRWMAEFRWKHLNKEQIWDTFLNSYRFVIGGNPYIKLESYELPFLHASSLRINEALLISALRGYVPFSDSIVHDRMMHRKVNRTLQLVARDHGLREKLEIEISTTLPYQHLSLAVLNRLVPDAELEKRSLSELVEYRNENESHLHRMRVALGSLAAELKVGDPGRDYYRAIQNLVESKVLPEIVKVREELVRNYEVAFGKLGIQSAQVTIPTLVATVFGGLGLWEVLGACALAELGMLAAKGADQLLDLWRARRISGRGAYCYLTEFGA